MDVAGSARDPFISAEGQANARMLVRAFGLS